MKIEIIDKGNYIYDLRVNDRIEITDESLTVIDRVVSALKGNYNIDEFGEIAESIIQPKLNL